ncbi:MAG: ABC transporter ATP-binding protein [Chloroflexi bacterium]|nr:ABC transporter ATP-binding protein [Chloroflexota bacterium]
MSSPSPSLLEVRDLSKSFRGVRALDDYALQLSPLTIHGVIGPNGAGKTTLFNLLTGFLKPTSGAVHLFGLDITSLPAAQIAQLGIARTFQNIRLFGNLPVIENVKVALQSQFSSSLLNTLVSASSFLWREHEIEAQALDYLELVGLASQRDRLARSLPYGDQRKLEIARAVAIKPKLLLLDEPTAGMNPSEAGEVLRLIRRLRDELKITIILVAHDIPMVMNLCEQIQVLNYGKLIAEGDPGAVRTNPEVISAYLGQAKYA